METANKGLCASRIDFRAELHALCERFLNLKFPNKLRALSICSVSDTAILTAAISCCFLYRIACNSCAAFRLEFKCSNKAASTACCLDRVISVKALLASKSGGASLLAVLPTVVCLRFVLTFSSVVAALDTAVAPPAESLLTVAEGTTRRRLFKCRAAALPRGTCFQLPSMFSSIAPCIFGADVKVGSRDKPSKASGSFRSLSARCAISGSTLSGNHNQCFTSSCTK